MDKCIYDVVKGVVLGAATFFMMSLHSAETLGAQIPPQLAPKAQSAPTAPKATPSAPKAAPAAPVTPKVTPKTQALPKIEGNWQEFHSSVGRCSMLFPKYPDHLSEKMRLPKEGFDLKYDAYISAVDQKTVFLLLIAQYPEFVDESYARMSLEGFLNGILTHNPNNQLIFADLSLVGGHEALDFFIRTGGVYFKGRALMVKNSLYLMAMECEVQNYDEVHYKKFIDSFSLSQ